MSIVCGIDEAGYGPLLGPLVVGSSTFEIDDERAGGRSLAQLLSPQVKWVKKDRDLSSSSGRKPLLVADSKRLYSKGRKIESLEDSVLAFVGASTGTIPRTLEELVALLGESWPAGLPWYEAPGPELPLGEDFDRVSLAAEKLAKFLKERGIRVRLSCRILSEPAFNGNVADAGNKANVLFNLALELILRAWDGWGAQKPGGARWVLDKQGARKFYGDLLSASFPLASIEVKKEQDRHSAYVLDTQRGRATVDFIMGGEDRELPIALGSMVSKYMREAFMVAFNRHWRKLIPGIHPTAGYYGDAHRFLKDIGPHLSPIGLQSEAFVRQC